MRRHPTVNIVELALALLLNEKSGAGMEPAGAERHRRSPKGELDGRRANQSNRRVARKPRCPTKPSEIVRRGRESNPRIAVLQTATLPLGYPADLRERTISL